MRPNPTIRLIAVLAVTQLSGWGTSFDMLSIFGPKMAPEVGLSPATIFAGLSVMMLVGALAGPLVGRLMGRIGARPVLAAGSLAMAAGDALLAGVHGPASFFAAWLVIGAAGALALTVPANTAIVERHGLGGRRIIGVLMLFTGTSATMFWPLLTLFDDAFGWRTTLMIAAVFHLLVSAPLHAFALPRRPDALPADDVRTAGPPPLRLSPAVEARAFTLLAATTALFAFVTFGVTPLLIALMEASGASPALALTLGSIRGLITIAARSLEITLGRRLRTTRLAMIAGVTLATAFPLLTLSGGHPATLALFVVAYAAGGGLLAIIRSLLPLVFFSTADFGRQSGRLALPQNMAVALAPFAFSALMGAAGADAVSWVALLISGAALSSMAALMKLERGARGAAPAGALSR